MSLYAEAKMYEIFVRKAGINTDHRDLINLIKLDNGIVVHRVDKEKLRARFINDLQRAITILLKRKDLNDSQIEALRRYDGQLPSDLLGKQISDIGDFLRKSTSELKA